MLGDAGINSTGYVRGIGRVTHDVVPVVYGRHFKVLGQGTYGVEPTAVRTGLIAQTVIFGRNDKCGGHASEALAVGPPSR